MSILIIITVSYERRKSNNDPDQVSRYLVKDPKKSKVIFISMGILKFSIIGIIVPHP